MKNLYVITLFCALSVAQIAAPVAMIFEKESVLQKGALYKFKTEPVDPYDAFRGRYVALRIEQDNIDVQDETVYTKDSLVYVSLGRDVEGYARIDSVSKTKPEGKDHIVCKVRYLSGKKVFFDFPMDRYYMNEKAAPLAERIYREQARGDRKNAYINVRVMSGKAVIEGLFIGGVSIEDVVGQKKG